MEIEVEYATIRLLDELYEIEKQSFQEEAFSKQQIGFLLEDYNAISLVAKIGGKIAGFIIGVIELPEGYLVGHILTIEVAPTYRRLGTAERLMIEFERILKLKDIEEIQLEVREGNEAAKALYCKLGYGTVSRLKNYYGSTHGLYLRKNL
jgi:[ribosomal protein S18]-alanine N-acetyltransferase